MLLDNNMFLWTARFSEYVRNVKSKGAKFWVSMRSVVWLLVAQSLSLLTVAFKLRDLILGLSEDVALCYEQF